MKKINPLIFIFITVFIDLIGFGIAIPILPIYATQFGVGAATIGMLVASYSFMQFIASPILGGLSDRYGRKKLLAISVLGTSVGFVITGFAPSILFVFLGRIVDGLTGGNISIAQAYIADVTSKKNRARGMGLIGAAFGLGFIIGPAIGGLLSKFGIAAPFLFAAILSLVNAIGIMLFLPESKKESTRPKLAGIFSLTAIKNAFTPAQVGAFIMLFVFVNLAFSMIHGTLPLLTQIRFNWTASQNGYLFAFFGIVGVTTQGVLIGRLVKRFGELIIMISGILLLGTGIFFMGFANSISVLFAGGAGLALGNGLIQPTIQGLISKYSNKDEQGEVLGIAQGLSALARTFGPLYGGWTFENVAVYFPYYSGAAVLFAMTIGSMFSFKWLNKTR